MQALGGLRREHVPAWAQGKGALALWSQVRRLEGQPGHVGLTGWWQGSCPGAALTCLLPPTIVVSLRQGAFVSPSARKVGASHRLEAPAGLRPEIPLLSQGDTVASPESPDIWTQTTLEA